RATCDTRWSGGGRIRRGAHVDLVGPPLYHRQRRAGVTGVIVQRQPSRIARLGRGTHSTNDRERLNGRAKGRRPRTKTYSRTDAWGALGGKAPRFGTTPSSTRPPAGAASPAWRTSATALRIDAPRNSTARRSKPCSRRAGRRAHQPRRPPSIPANR